jgi:4-hydroxy-tetrahydrodipicolinate synthase
VSETVLPGGVYTVVPTPFTEDGALDLPSLERLITFLVARGVTGLLVLGVLGEAPKLLPDERRAVVETALAAAGGLPVVVGATHPSSVGVRALAGAAERAGAAAVLVAPPRLDRAVSDDALVDYFRDLAASTALEIVLQDHPTSSGVHLPAELVARIATEVPQVSAVKLEDPPTPLKVERVLDLGPPGLKVYGGLGGVFLLEELGRGAHGTMTGFAFPELLVEVVRAHAAQDEAKAAELFFRILPLVRFEFQEAIGLGIRKRIYRLRGAIESDHVRAPALALDGGSARELERLLHLVNPLLAWLPNGKVLATVSS